MGVSILDHVYIRKSLSDHFDVIVNVKSTFFSDREAIRVALLKKV